MRRPSRAALVLTGHLRDTCDTTGAFHTLARQVQLCRAHFDCDVFLHTWSVLDRSTDVVRPGGTSRGDRAIASRHLRSSWPCVHNLSIALNLTAAQVETQLPEADQPLSHVYAAYPRWMNAWAMSMNAATMAGGMALARRHAAAMGITYSAAVRMRADVGSHHMKPAHFQEQFLSRVGWTNVARRASDLTAGYLSADRATELVTCGRPYLKRVDFCSWSVPPRPLDATLALLADFAQSFGPDGSACAAFLRERVLPQFMENTLICAAHMAGNVTMSSFWDGRLWDNQPNCNPANVNPADFGCVAALTLSGLEARAGAAKGRGSGRAVGGISKAGSRTSTFQQGV